MKLIICLLFMLISAKECNESKSKNTSEISSEATTELSEMRTAQDDVEVSYRASTRGFFELITIKGDSISFTNDYNLKRINTFAIPAEEKEEFNRLLSELDITTLSELKAPSKTHQYDAAPAAFLKVTKGDEEFMSPSFDHGKPPKTISAIIEKILSIKSMFEKQ
ncbi:hypothetical protein [Winogradskyella ouciana]|uniref:hypothetical protein n=1 Tax=Winogradskyella ouciana TaxID=2608631 RepID=UPI003D2D8068